MGIAPTGNRVEFSAIDIARIAEGKIVEHWSNSDQLGMMQQLGVMEQPSG
jgi:predicted ester cyclase